MRHYLYASIFSGLSFLIAQSVIAADTDSADVLVTKIKTAIVAKDIESAAKLVNWGNAPIPAYRLFKMSIADCFNPPECSVEKVTISEEEKNPQGEYKFVVPPEGQIKIKSSEGEDGLTMPYAKVNGEYRIIIGQLTKEGYERTKASTDARKLADELDPDLLANGQKLASDGGEPASAYREYSKAIVEGKTDYLALNGTDADRYFYANAYKDNPIKKQISLELAQMENIQNATIKEGYRKDNRALLLVSGVNGLGWTSEGVVTLALNDNKWTLEDKTFTSYPPNTLE